MLMRVVMAPRPSVGIPSTELYLPRSEASLERPKASPSGSSRERFRRYTPVKIVRKPQRREMVFTASVVLKPWKRMKLAVKVQVVKVT